MRDQKISELVDYFGSQSTLAGVLGITKQSVSQWVSQGYMPVRQAMKVEKVTDGKFKAIDLCTGDVSLFNDFKLP